MQIKRYRNICGLTQEELARKLGVHQTAVAQWESGRTNPNMHRLLNICSILRCTVDELIADTPNEEQNRTTTDNEKKATA